MFRKENNEYMKMKDKENYEKHKEKRKEVSSKIDNCVCGSTFKHSNFQNHKILKHPFFDLFFY